MTILTHPQALRRIMINLIDNGLKFGEDVEVAIDAQRSNGITITVSDRGPGIPDEHLKSVFLPFYRVEASRNRETGGTGLGLAIAQQLVSALRGTLTLANRDGGGLEARLGIFELTTWRAESAENSSPSLLCMGLFSIFCMRACGMASAQGPARPHAKAPSRRRERAE